MRILVTGHRGHIGVPVAAFLRGRGHEVAGFDRADGADLLDLASVQRAAAGCAGVAHTWARSPTTAQEPPGRSWRSTCWGPGMYCWPPKPPAWPG